MRQFLSPVVPDKNGMLRADGKDFRYLRQVLRLKTGDMISVRSPDGTLTAMTVCQVDESARSLLLQVCGSDDAVENTHGALRGVSAHDLDAHAAVEYWLFQFIAKPQKMDTIIRQSVECGVACIVPVSGEYSQAGCIAAMEQSGGRSERISRIIREAREQSGSPVNTRVTDPVSLADAVQMWHDCCDEYRADETAAVVLSERNSLSEPVHRVIGRNGELKTAAVAVGSEGGISPQEITVLRGAGFIPVHFAGNILRCETAALYGIAAVQAAVMERDVWQSKELK